MKPYDKVKRDSLPLCPVLTMFCFGFPEKFSVSFWEFSCSFVSVDSYSMHLRLVLILGGVSIVPLMEVRPGHTHKRLNYQKYSLPLNKCNMDSESQIRNYLSYVPSCISFVYFFRHSSNLLFIHLIFAFILFPFLVCFSFVIITQLFYVHYCL